MFFSLFASKNQKLVKQWSAEHEEIVSLATTIITQYSENNHKAAKKAINKLKSIAINHLMTEDVELFSLLHEDEKFDDTTEKLVHDFQESFRGIKLALMDFLKKYSHDEAVLDDEFFQSFNEIVAILANRIEFEEKNLYNKLKQ